MELPLLLIEFQYMYKKSHPLPEVNTRWTGTGDIKYLPLAVDPLLVPAHLTVTDQRVTWSFAQYC
jgi:hypothetical protein